jgi:hypothetical protein
MMTSSEYQAIAEHDNRKALPDYRKGLSSFMQPSQL